MRTQVLRLILAVGLTAGSVAGTAVPAAAQSQPDPRVQAIARSEQIEAQIVLRLADPTLTDVQRRSLENQLRVVRGNIRTLMREIQVSLQVQERSDSARSQLDRARESAAARRRGRGSPAR